MVGPGGEKGRPSPGRHGTLSARAPSDLFGPHLCRVGNRDPEKNLNRAPWRRFYDFGLFWAKARREERFLRTELSEDAYDAYARKTPMLVPFE
jgi:hypothetical protein